MPNAMTIAELGAMVGRERRGTGHLLARDDCPIPPMPPWTARQVKEFKAWFVTLQRDRAQPLDEAEDGDVHAGSVDVAAIVAANPKTAAAIALSDERMRKTRIERQILEGRFVRRSAVRAEFERYCHIVKNHILQAPRGLAPRMKAKDEDRMKRALRVALTAASVDLMRAISEDEDLESQTRSRSQRPTANA